MSGSHLRSAIARVFGHSTYDHLRISAFHLREFARCTTPRKLANLIMIKAQRGLKRSRVTGMPVSYFIDPINVCNLHCPLCPTGRGILARPRGRMGLVELTQIVGQIAPYAYRVELYNWGEPLLHPDIFQMIAYVRERRISTGLSSNLNHLDPAMARQLVESGLSQLVVSIDGATQDSYAVYRRGGKLEKVLENLQLLVDTRRSLKRSTPFIIARMLVGKHNEHEVEAVRTMVYGTGVDGFTTGRLFVDTQDLEQIEQWIPDDPAYSAYGSQGSNLSNTWDCHDLWESMVINWDGGVAPCCWLHDPQYDFGNASDQALRDIWNSPAYVSARRVMGKRERDQAGDVPTICHRCRGRPHYMAY
jgi:radical SAM protein with 4Fe4S-binding SPASM domain